MYSTTRQVSGVLTLICTGTLLYNKYFTPDGKLSKDDNYDNLVFDKVDPAKVAAQFFALMKMAALMHEEYKDEYPEQLERD